MELTDTFRDRIERVKDALSEQETESVSVQSSIDGMDRSLREEIPFTVTRDNEKGGLRVYVPEGSLIVNGESLEIENVHDDYVSLPDGDWSISIRVYDLSDGGEPTLKAYIEDTNFIDKSVYSLPLVLSFRMAKVNNEGCVTQYVSGAVNINGQIYFDAEDNKEPSLVPFKVFSYEVSDSFGTRTTYRMFTPKEGTLQYQDELVPIQESVGDWTLITAAKGEQIWCWMKDGKAHIGIKSAVPKDSLFSFPVASLDEDEESSDESSDGADE